MSDQNFGMDTKPSDISLEIDTGSGYQSTILSCMVQQVYSVEIIENLVTKVHKRLNTLGYNNISLRTGDGYFGWPEHVPYDGTIVMAAVSIGYIRGGVVLGAYLTCYSRWTLLLFENKL